MSTRRGAKGERFPSVGKVRPEGRDGKDRVTSPPTEHESDGHESRKGRLENLKEKEGKEAETKPIQHEEPSLEGK